MQHESEIIMSVIAVECAHCGAELIDGVCEYCGSANGGARPVTIEDKILNLKGIYGSLTVTKDTCTFKPLVGNISVIKNKEITGTSFKPAPLTGAGELRIATVTGVTKKITFLYNQNPVMESIVSYLLYAAPNNGFSQIDNAVKNSTREVVKKNSKIILILCIVLALVGVKFSISALFLIGTVCAIVVARVTRRPKPKKPK